MESDMNVRDGSVKDITKNVNRTVMGCAQTSLHPNMVATFRIAFTIDSYLKVCITIDFKEKHR